MSTLPDRITNLAFFPMHEPPAHDAQGQRILRLNLNESPLPPSPKVIEAVAQACMTMNLYPDGEAQALLTALSAHTGWPEEKIFVGAGSNELLAASAEITLNPGDEMIAPVPAFPTYRKLATLRDATFVGVPLHADGRIDLDAMLKAVNPQTRLMFVSSPHNPSGTVMSPAEIARLSAELPAHVMLHFDEAYYEFGRAGGGPETLPILQSRNGPWISTRTFSKAYGLAGARVGYGLAGSVELAQAIRKVRPNFSLSRPALAAGLAALEDMPYAHEIVAKTLSEAQRMCETLATSGFQAFDCAANFIAVIAPTEGADLVAQLKAQGILISSFALGETTALRITIGSSEDNDRVLSALLALVKNAQRAQC